MIERPMPFREAVEYLLKKKPNPQEWSSAEWSAEQPAVRVRSMFSAHVESARFLDRMQGLIFDYMVGTTEEVTGPDGKKRTLRRIGSRADFVKQMRDFMVAEGMVREEEFRDVNRNDLTDIRSSARLELIFDTNVRQAYGYGKWRQGMTPAVRRAFPAARFVRETDVGEPRPRHAASEGQVRLKTDYDFWADFQNDPEIGGFGVPWGPYGFRSGMGQDDVSRDEVVKLGFLGPDQSPPDPESMPGFNDDLWASLKTMNPELKKKLVDELEAGIVDLPPAEEQARRAAKEARKKAMARSERAAIAKGDREEAARIRKLIDLGVPGNPLVVGDERISLAKGAAASATEKFKRAEGVFKKIERKLPDPAAGKKGVSRARSLMSSGLAITPEERIIVDSPHEILIVHDASGRIQKATLGSTSAVRVPQSPDGSILTHNHPGGRGPSDADLAFVMAHPGKTLRVVARDESGAIELFRFKAGPMFNQRLVPVVLQVYASACRAGGNTPAARRRAIALITDQFPGMLTIEHGTTR